MSPKNVLTSTSLSLPDNVLVVDTSTSACCLALKVKEKILEDFEIVGRSHSEVILPKIVSLLERSNLELEDLQLIIYGQGPGSFTGLRIAVGVVQGLAFGLDIPLVAVSGLAALAQGEFREHGGLNSLVAMTARKEEVYWGRYKISDGVAKLVSTECVVDVSDLEQLEQETWAGVGSGWVLRSEIEASIGQKVSVARTDLDLRPLDFLTLGLWKYVQGEFMAAEDAQPVYLREEVAN